MNDTVKLSSLISSQLPDFISQDDSYSTFVSFMEAYYEWMETNKGVYSESRNLKDYGDIDKTLDEFVDYFYGEFLPSFPREVLADKRRLLKYSKSLFESKGTPSSYKFLFKVLYDSDCEILETQDFVLRASSGKWFLPKSIKVKTNDSRFILTQNLFVFGEDSKTLAKIERAKIVNDKVEIFISDVERLFQVGEYVKIVDVNLQELYFDPEGNVVSSEKYGEILRAKVSSSISSVEVRNRGNYYNVGNPVVFYNGLPDPLNDIGASAEVGEVTTGSIQRVTIDKTSGDWGYRFPYTAVYVDPDPDKKTIITVGSVSVANGFVIDNIISDSLRLKENVVLNWNPATGLSTDPYTDYGFSALIKANVATKMSDVFSFQSFETFPLDTITVQNGGGGFNKIPVVTAESVYQTNLPISQADSYDPRYDFDHSGTSKVYASLPLLGILGPVFVSSNTTSGALYSGRGYALGDEITFSGIGSGAFANVTSIDANGGILTVNYYQKANVPAPKGGFGYDRTTMPVVSIAPKYNKANTTNNSNLIVFTSNTALSNLVVGQTISGNGIPGNTTVSTIYSGNSSIKISNSATGTYISNTYSLSGSGALLYVDGIMGGAAKLNPTTDRIGSVTTINITNYGEDYASTPNVSLKIQDFAVSNVNILHPPQKGDIVYQGNISDRSSYYAYVDSATLVELNQDPLLSKYVIRTYQYNVPVNITQPISLLKTGMVSPNTFNMNIVSDYVFLNGYNGIKQDTTGVVTYGDGTATAIAKFLNGLILGQGRYISEEGHPSSYSVLESENYNNYTYILTVDKEISKYRQILYDTLHPSGTKVIGQASIKSDIDKGMTIEGGSFSKSLFTDYEFIFYGIGAEINSISGQLVPILLGFQDDATKYGYVNPTANNKLTIYPFPERVLKGKEIVGTGLPAHTLISDVYIGNSSVVLSNACTTSANSVSLVVQDVVDYDLSTNFKLLQYPFTANLVYGQTVVKIAPSANAISSLAVGQTVSSDPIIFTGTTNANSYLITQVSTTGNVLPGQIISSKYVPSGTKVIKYYNTNNTIVMSNTATANSGANYEYFRNSNSVFFTASLSNNSVLMTNVNSGGNAIEIGKQIFGNGIFSGATVAYYYGSNNVVVMSNPATGTVTNGEYTVSTYAKYTSPIYRQLIDIPYNTKVVAINSNTITLSQNCVTNSQTSILYFTGDSSSIYGGNNYMILRCEPGTIPERSY